MVRMNLFQRLTRCWDQIHPYNAAQVMRLSLSCTHTLAQQAWDSTLMDLGLGNIEVQARRYRHRAGTGPVCLLPTEIEPGQFMSEQLNTPFVDSQSPFRPFLQIGDQGAVAGIVYHHWVADSVSIRLLMREWFFRLAGCGQPRRQPVPILCDELSRPVSSSRSTVLDLLRRTRDLKAVRRLPKRMCQDMRVAHRILHLPDGTAQALRQAARQRGAKVTDLLLCTLAELCERHLPPASAHRPNLALGSIRDIRPDRQLDDPDAFGAELAFANVLCPAGILPYRPALLQHIAKQTAAHRGRQSGSVSDLDMRLALLALGLIRQERATEFFRKRMPFSAGLSNMDLSRTWVAQYPEIIKGYYRVSPAGPALPLVISPTTVGQQFNISLTWRTSVLSETALETLAADLQHSLSTWVATPNQTPAYEPAA